MKTIAQHERERNMIILGDDIDPTQKISEDDFKELTRSHEHVGVDYDFREKWLKKNGYKVTRENLTNADLPSKQQQAEEAERGEE